MTIKCFLNRVNFPASYVLFSYFTSCSKEGVWFDFRALTSPAIVLPNPIIRVKDLLADYPCPQSGRIVKLPPMLLDVGYTVTYIARIIWICFETLAYTGIQPLNANNNAD
jgi:hypothetical protein